MKNKKSNFYVVGIGASAGGLDAIQTLFDNIPNNTGMAFIIIQHLSPDFKSLMPELLSRHTSMPIFTAEDKQTIKPNCIYLNQSSKKLHIQGAKLYVLDKEPKPNLNLPIDIFFHTLGEAYKDKSIGVILSGTGSDGSRGIKTIKEAGGTIIVQDPITAQFDGMPNAAISTNCVDYILNPQKIAEIFCKKPINRDLLTTKLEENASNETLVNDILTIIYEYSGIDFREYKSNTLLRRLEKRMDINNIEHVLDYKTFLSSDTAEQKALKEDFLIGVTRFFRDRDAFIRLKKEVIPNICKSKSRNETIRVWVAGCSTGEEVYTLAILLDDYIRTHQLNIDFKVFATDIDSRALAIAGHGMYHVNIIKDIEKVYLDTYFVGIGNKFQIIKRIREKIVFSNHNLIKDPPFIRMDLITCRNLLIYFDNKIQKKVMFNFQFALNQFSYLFLGTSESLGEVSDCFKPIDVKWKIFQNISESKQIPSHSNNGGRISTIAHKYPSALTPHIEPQYKTKGNPELYFHKFLSKKFSPASIFIDKHFNILFIKGDAGKRLTHNEGVFEHNVLKTVSPDIATIIRSGIKRLEEGNQDIVIKDVVNKTDNGNFLFDLYFHKANIDDNMDSCYLIEFSNDKEEVAPQPLEITNINLDHVSSQRLEDLENELKIAKTELQNAIEELETSNEELQSTNEELMASNEELQSANEELQSVNEELYSVNIEMQEKNKELTNLNNDVSNLLDNTGIATLFLDRDLRIRKFTPGLKEIFNLHEADYGRPLSSFTSNFSQETRDLIIKDSKLVLDKLTVIEKQVKDIYNNYYLKRISPFITENKTVNGVVITLYNINDLKHTEEELVATGIKYQRLFENLNEGFLHAKIVTDIKGVPIGWKYLDVNPKYEELLGVDKKLLIGNELNEVIHYLKHDPTEWISTFGKTALTGEEQAIEEYRTLDGKCFYVHLFSPVKGEFGATFTDITELLQKEEALKKSEKELFRVQEITHVGSWYLDLATDNVTWTSELYKMYKLDPNKSVPEYTEHKKLFKEESWERITKAIENTKRTGEPYQLELEIIKHNNELGWMWTQGEIVKDETGNVIGLRGAARDITQQKRNELELIKAKQLAENANLHKNYFLANMSHEIRTPMSGILGFSELLKNDDLPQPERIKYLDIIDSNSKQLLNLIDDIIDIAKIESNEIKIIEKPCHIPDLINNLEITYNQLKIVRLKQNITFRTHIPEAYRDLVLLTDEHRLQQVISNLLNNALKFSEQGEIFFGFNVEGDYLKFFVKDQGIGIEKDKQSEIFERFKQLNYESSEKYGGGTGLGLSICKGIVNLLGGDIMVSSVFRAGSLFEFTIPLKIEKLQDENTKKFNIRDIDFLKEKTILIVEDGKLFQKLYMLILKNTGAHILFASTGKEAIAVYQNTPKIDVVLLDIRMPEMSGIEALGKILILDPEAKIIMQTANVMVDEKQKCFEMGCVDFLVKPVAQEDLFKTLHKWLQPHV
ncbi:chemotaxis protein CheB [Formosa sp. 3Alg 14/1]|uniref:chemotaxis protein CheB n=1 Tax=Formosa sp. 3Alg 14/1 TaxID=3382190 RepID=UPI0039BDD417